MTVLMKIPPEFSVLPEFTEDASNPHPMDRPGAGLESTR
jgi:hypothetical protein